LINGELKTRCVWRNRVVTGSRIRGMTLLELLITMVILSILAAAALPYAEKTMVRGKELELRRSLREIRTAIDRFHEDWAAGKVSHLSAAASDDGYPKTLNVLVDGVDLSQAKGGKVKYLRRIPEDPFAIGADPASQWLLRAYQDDRNALTWGGKDVYDVRSSSSGTAIDGSRYRDW
jgi:general secretion pathway protein G